MDGRKSSSVFPAGAAVDSMTIALLWSLMVLIVKPLGDFPLNDDWSYGMAVKRLVAGEGYRPVGWTEMTLITQALWGALFCLPHGFSFTALRFSTLAFSLVGMLAMYVLIRQLQRPRMLAVCCALTLGCNPIYFALSNTFMTDVPFTTLAILTALFYVRHLQGGSDLDLIIGTAFAIATILCRQLGLCLPLAVGATLLLKHGFQRRWIIRAVLPSLISIGILAAFQHWLKAAGKLPALYNLKAERLVSALTHPMRIPVNVAYYGWSMLMYLGWFLLPVTLPAVFKCGPSRSRSFFVARLALFLFLVASVVRFIVVPSLMPVHNNVLIPQGIGPATLRDTYSLRLPHLPALPLGFWLVVTALSLVGAGILIFKVSGTVVDLLSKEGRLQRASDNGSAQVFFLICASAYLLPFILSGFFDRYLLPVVAFLLAFVAMWPEAHGYRLARMRYVPVLLLIGSFAVFSVAGTRDYLEWNRTRWKAAEDLLAQKDVKPKDIDGGFEFNGWYLFDTFTKTNWWVVDDTYVIAFGDIPGYDPVRRYSYVNWMPPRGGNIFVLKRKN
jgi:hypothetical protein